MALTIAKAVKKLLIAEPFYGLFLMSLNKYFDDKIPTACVRRNGINTELAINEKFWNSLSDKAEIAILKHEAGHIIFGHLTMQEAFPNKKHFNICADVNVNSYIEDLPPNACTADKYGVPPMCGTKWYYENIPEEKDQDPPENHNWDDFQNCSDAEKQLIQNQIDHIVKQTAEQVQKMCGNIPGQFKEYIDGLFAKKPAVFNWKNYFRRVVGNSIRSYIKSTRYRPSKRFKGQPGNVLKFKPKVLVAVDTSGSVSNDELQDFFSEVEHLYKSGVCVDVIEFDTCVTSKFEYKGAKTEIPITGRGGTDATDAVNYYIQHREYSTLVIFTDGYLSINLPKAQNMIWVITSNGCHQAYPGISVYIPKIEK